MHIQKGLLTQIRPVMLKMTTGHVRRLPAISRRGNKWNPAGHTDREPSAERRTVNERPSPHRQLVY